MTVSSIMLLRSGTEENFEKKQELWRYLKAKDRKLYLKIRTGLLGRAMNLPGKGVGGSHGETNRFQKFY